MNTGLPLLAALIEFGVIIWLALSLRAERREKQALDRTLTAFSRVADEGWWEWPTYEREGIEQ